MSRSNSNIVVEWLKSLHLGQYSESFLDNGYDDLEICKQVGDPDLDAIGVFNPSHRLRLLHSVRTLREEGAASVYFTLEETPIPHLLDECSCDTASSRTESSISKHDDPRVSSRNSSRSEGSKKDFKDEYEEGRAELVKIPKLQLKLLVKEKLTQDGIKLSQQPYSTTNGERGYLEGLASRYADLFNTHYGDVLEHLEEHRRREWEEMSPRIRVLQTPDTPTKTYTSAGHVTPVSVHSCSLTTSLSQPIYVPGKYSPSSCLSDKEEDEIYGFAGYGVYGKQMLQRQQQRIMLQAHSHQQDYQTCLSPRSAYFYEFPPSEQHGSQTCKKKTSFSKFLRGLKTVHRKEKHGGSSPRHGRLHYSTNNSRVGTPDSLLDGPPMLPTPAMDPRMINYDKLRVLQLNGSSSNFEETIHRLKIQDAMKKKERFHREHEEILRDIRQGLLKLGREAARGNDDTYMYDDEVSAMTSLGGIGGHHWYDEPPYESDPEDFLMGITSGQPSATIQNGRVCFTLNLRSDTQREGVMSHPSAGDISLPRDGRSKKGNAPRRGLILPQTGPYPPTIIPLTHARSCRDSGDYSADVQSLNSRLSTLSVETSRSEQYLQLPIRKSSASDHSSDYEDQELPSPLGRSHDKPGSTSRHRGQRSHEKRSKTNMAIPSTSSAESIPSGSGSSTQALVREASGKSSLSTGDDCETQIGPAPQGGHIPAGPVIGKARALVDCIPNHYDKEALKFKKGDIIDITQMNQSGLWQGVCNGRTGLFKFINVELLSEKAAKRLKVHQNKIIKKGKPKTVEELLKRINMEEHTSVFVLNGYEDVELFQDLEGHDLDFLGIRDPEHRAKLLTAVQLLHDYDSDNCDIRSSSESGSPVSATGSNKSARQLGHKTSSLKNLRDSGCYDSNSVEGHPSRRKYKNHDISSSNNLDGKQSRRLFQTLNTKTVRTPENVESVEMEILSNNKVTYHPNIPLNEGKKAITKEFLEQTREVLDRAREVTNVSREIREQVEEPDKRSEESCDAHLQSKSKYVVSTFETNNEISNVFSERSSDSGVSSSSLSSNNIRDRVKVHLESPKQSCKSYNQTSPTLESKNPFLVNTKTKENQNGGSFKDSKRNRSSPTRNFPVQFQNRSSPGLVIQKKN